MYKWKPSKAQRKAFAIKMQDVDERNAYEQRRKAKAEKRRKDSNYNYDTAGGYYVPTESQFHFAMKRPGALTDEQIHACDMIVFAYSCNEKVHHDYIHIINELIRKI